MKIFKKEREKKIMYIVNDNDTTFKVYDDKKEAWKEFSFLLWLWDVSSMTKNRLKKTFDETDETGVCFSVDLDDSSKKMPIKLEIKKAANC